MLSPLEAAYLAYITNFGGRAGGKKPIYWGAQAGTGVGGVDGASGGTSVRIDVRILPNGGVNTNGENIKEKKVIENDDKSITTIVTSVKGVVTVTTTPATTAAENRGEKVVLPKDQGTVYIPTQVEVNTEARFARTDTYRNLTFVQSTTTIRFSDGSTMVIRDPEREYTGERGSSSLQLLGVDDAFIERMRLEDTLRIERERIELIDALKDGRIRVIQTGTGAQYLNYKEGTEGHDELAGGGMLNGLGGDDVLTGADDPYGMDVLDGGNGNDTLNGGQGLDILVGGAGADKLNGGDGFDMASYAPASSAIVVNMADVSHNTGDAAGDGYGAVEGIVGSEHNDKITGNNYSNRLEGGGGKDTIDGAGGSDDLYGDDGDDVLIGGSGADTFDGGEGHDTVSYYKSLTAVQIYMWSENYNVGAKGDTYKDIEGIDGTRFDDVIEGNTDANTFWGDAGNDTLNGHGGSDTLAGGDGDDKLEGGWGNWGDRLDGGNGRDTASYYHATSGVQVYLWDVMRNTGEAEGDTYVSIEVIDGSTHSDTIEGSASANTFWGDAGHDLLKGLGGADTLSGGAGGDHLSGGEGADLLDGGADFDFAVYADAASGVLVDLLAMGRNTGEASGDVYVSIEGLIGSGHADQFYGTAGWDGFYAGAGDDVLEGRGGGDQLDGGDGFDFAVYWGAASGVVANLAAGGGTLGDAAGDVFVSIEGLQGSNHADTLTGNGIGNTLYGWGGNDELHGLSGNDYIEGGDGADTISGGESLDWLLGNAGRDVFRFDTRASAGNVDTLADFNAAEDKIALETRMFGFAPVTYDAWGSPVNGTLTTSAFKLGTSATTAAQRIVYDQASGAVYFDADGLGGQAQVQFAKVAAGTALTAAHFQLFTL